MNTHNNKRRQETVKRIEAAFLEQLKDRELSQINVTQLCKTAGINRGTFYANYYDVYHLADEILRRVEQEVEQLLERDVRKDYNETDFLKILIHIKNNQELYNAYFRLGTKQHKDMPLFAVSPQWISEDAEIVEMHITFFMSGFNGMVKKWLAGGCKQSPEQMMEILMREYHGRLYWRLP